MKTLGQEAYNRAQAWAHAMEQRPKYGFSGAMPFAGQSDHAEDGYN